jgi:RNA polymerase sigma-70 factor (ECF subfamily)
MYRPAPAPPSPELVARLRAGDESAFAQLYGEWHGPIYDYCARMLGDRDEAQDLTQEVFVTAWCSLPQQGELKLKGWLYRVATNACLSRLRRGGGPSQEEPAVERLESTVDEYERARTAALIEGALGSLNDRYRTAVVLRDLHGLRADELAAALSVSRASADVLTHRARASFRRAFRALAGDSPAPADLAAVLVPLSVPAALQTMPALPPAPWLGPAATPAPDLSSAGPSLLAKIGTALSIKVAAGAAAGAALLGGGIAATTATTPPAAPASPAPAPALVKHHDGAAFRWGGHGHPDEHRDVHDVHDASAAHDGGSGHDGGGDHSTGGHDGGTTGHSSGTTDGSGDHAGPTTGTHDATTTGGATTGTTGTHDTGGGGGGSHTGETHSD